MAKIKTHRKVTYYIGLVLIIVGIILFISVFFTAAQTFSSLSSPFPGNGPFGGGIFFPLGRAVIGILMIIVGAVLCNIGARGAAGSGFVLDPDQAREDLKPFNEARGKMINDVISNIDVLDDISLSKEVKEVIKIKCSSCGRLNDEDARYCNFCGKEI